MVYLKKIDAYGFKSFAHKVTVEFDAGITGIVGPNGSGKSNITDAIKWVLGEQSAKKLRGQKMQDVIFSGTKTKKPLNYAEVTLFLDNSSGALNIDDNELIVSRRLYRNGDSEYLLNKEPARLKDVIDLFMDSGLGKDAFSIISQGKVDEVLNAKAIDRRVYVEEVAGVLKYKKKKEQSSDKLNKTIDNLNRVNDILSELESRVEPLKRDSEIAKEYLALSDELKTVDVQTHVYEIHHQSEAYDRIKKYVLELEDIIELNKSRYKKLSNEQENNKEERKTLEDQISELHQQRVKEIEQKTRYDGQIELIKERINMGSQSQDDLIDQLEQLTKEENSINASLEQLNKDITSNQSKGLALTNQLNDLKSQRANIDSDNTRSIDDIRDEYYEIKTKEVELKNEIHMIENDLDRKSHERQRFEKRHQQLLKERTVLEDKEEDLRQQLSQLNTQLEEKRIEYKQLNQTIETIQQQYEQNGSKLTEAKRLFQEHQYKIGMLKRNIDNLSGYFQGVKAILNSTHLKGIHGTVADLIKIDSKYVTAIETALGNRLQSIVVDRSVDARRAIQFLKDHKKGRATFIPIESVSQQNILNVQQIRHMNGYIGLCHEVIEYQPKYKYIMEQALSKTVLVDTLANANEISREMNYKVRIVTLDGEIVSPGGSMTGGYKNTTTSVLNDKADYESMIKSTPLYEQKLNNLEQTVSEQYFKLKELQSDLSMCSEEGSRISEKVNSIDLELMKALESKDFITEQIEFIKVDSSSNEGVQQLSILREEKESISKKLNDLEQLLERTSQTDEERAKEKERLIEEEQQLNVDLNIVQTDIKHSQSKIVEYQHRLKDIDAQIKYIHDKKTRTSSDDEQNEQQIIELEEKLSNINASLQQTINQIESWQQKLSLIDSTIDQNDTSLKQFSEMIQMKSTELNQAKQKLARIDIQIEQHIETLSEDYRLSYDEAKSTYGLTEEIANAKQKVKLLKKSIDELGSINMNAIEEYETVKTRYDFLNDERNDLQSAYNTLTHIIQELDNEVRTRFQHTFDEINNHFKETFAQLFGGGQAELQLTEEDYLTAGIELFIQPPGKKVKSLSLMSGGERALTALALLFAILKVRSAPFVILDEVEAALDDANVIRYANYLNQLKSETQFIIITHRKGTMENVDRLFGVTMEQSGISKLVSVNLKEIDQMEGVN